MSHPIFSAIREQKLNLRAEDAERLRRLAAAEQNEHRPLLRQPPDVEPLDFTPPAILACTWCDIASLVVVLALFFACDEVVAEQIGKDLLNLAREAAEKKAAKVRQ